MACGEALKSLTSPNPSPLKDTRRQACLLSTPIGTNNLSLYSTRAPSPPIVPAASPIKVIGLFLQRYQHTPVDDDDLRDNTPRRGSLLLLLPASPLLHPRTSLLLPPFPYGPATFRPEEDMRRRGRMEEV